MFTTTLQSLGRLSLVVLFWASTLAVTSSAAIVQFFSRADFENAIDQSTLLDFENLTSGSVSLGNSVVFADATISASPGRVFSTTEFGAPSVQISSLDNFPLTIELSAGYHAIGMDVGTLNLIGSAQNFTLMGPSGTLLTTSHLLAENDFLGTPNTTFFGFVSDAEEIRSLRLSPVGTAFLTIDNVRYGTVVAIPEPTTLPLLVMFATSTACLLRKRRKTMWGTSAAVR